MDWRFWILLVLSTSGCHLYEDGALQLANSQRASDLDAGSPDSAREPEQCEPNPDAGAACRERCPEQCNGKDDDCDGRIDEGSAHASCAADAAEGVCSAGHCEIVRCSKDARDCDGLAANGCEVKVDDADHCGSCERQCLYAHASGVCENKQCELGGCAAGYADCDADSRNGCETSVRTDSHCGGCGITCKAGASCVGGACVSPDSPDPAECTLSPYAADSCSSDLCPDDPDKLAPGSCGCGSPDTDSDADGTLDCNDVCPNGAWTSTEPCLPYAPANIDPKLLDFSNTAAVTFDCGVTTLDTSHTTPVLSNSCGATPRISVQTQGDGSSVTVLTMRDLTVAKGSSLRLVGSRPVVFAVLGDAVIDGSIDASANRDTPGAGGDVACSASTGKEGSGNFFFGAGGGGGGGFGTSGGAGGLGDDARAGAGGAVRGSESLVPLLGGCSGGRGGGCNETAAGGGALQLSASGRVSVRGAIRANGAAGVKGCGFEGGGSGGGSGGAILIEARAIEAAPLALEANGGNGGEADGVGGAGSTAPTLVGGAGENDSANGGGGGGGGYGRIRTLLH
ncbi:MAG TPA: hypothetical protein VFN67_08585 [Polyangiales bacterium]|nr:hypothetical protein [Polyangiales bacterium]